MLVAKQVQRTPVAPEPKLNKPHPGATPFVHPQCLPTASFPLLRPALPAFAYASRQRPLHAVTSETTQFILIPPGAFTPIHSFGIPSSSSPHTRTPHHTTDKPSPRRTAQPSTSTTISHSLLRLSARARHPLREHLHRLIVTRDTSARERQESSFLDQLLK